MGVRTASRQFVLLSPNLNPLYYLHLLRVSNRIGLFWAIWGPGMTRLQWPSSPHTGHVVFHTRTSGRGADQTDMGLGRRLAILLILRVCFVNFLSMSSRDFPRVSGTQNRTKKNATKQMTPNIQNVYPVPSWVTKSLNVSVTTEVHAQLKAVATLAAGPRILAVINGKQN